MAKREPSLLRTLCATLAALLVWALILSCAIGVALMLPPGWDHVAFIFGAVAASVVSSDVLVFVREVSP